MKKIGKGLIIVVTVIFIIGIISSLNESNESELDSEKKVLKYLKSKYKNETFTIKDKKIEHIDNDGNCENYDEYTWTIISDSGIEFEVISGYIYEGAFVCQKYNHDTYKNKVIDEFISNKNYINISRNEYGDIYFNQNELEDEAFIEAVYNTISDLRKSYPFKDENIYVEVYISMNNGTKKYLKLKDINSLTYLKAELSNYN